MTEKPLQPETMEFLHEGEKVIGRRVEVVGRSEPASTFSLADGSVLSVRLVLIDVYRLEGVQRPDGRSVYRYGTQVVTHVWPKSDKE